MKGEEMKMNEEKMMRKKMGEDEPVTPFMEIMRKLDEAIKNPDPSVLKEIKSDLMDLEPIIEGDDREGMDEETDLEETDGEKQPSLVIAIGKMKKKQGGMK